MPRKIDAPSLKAMINDGQELALLDVREHGEYGEGHMLLAVSIPYSVLESEIDARVPRRSVRMVLVDGGDGVAERAAARLTAVGYTDVAILDGGIAAWEKAGYVVFKGENVLSKAFGEVVEHACHTPAISADELQAMFDAKEDIVVLDSRTPAEYKRMSIPNGINVPGAELAYRVHDLAPSPDTLVVVNCAGRTRSIIGAQSLINAGIPNRVVALRGGTLGTFRARTGAWRQRFIRPDHTGRRSQGKGGPGFCPPALRREKCRQGDAGKMARRNGQPHAAYRRCPR